MGALIPLGGQGFGPILSFVTNTITTVMTAPEAIQALASSFGPWRPPGWSNGSLYSVQVPATSQPNAPANASPQIYVFDAVIRAEHARTVRLTEHPVQTGAIISDHAIRLPAKVVLEIGMSDAMDSYPSTAGWTTNPSKSVSAFQVMVGLQSARVLLTVCTRLQMYQNMVIENIRAVEDDKSVKGLRATISFREVFIASVNVGNTKVKDSPSGVTLSNDSNTTDSTATGTVQTQLPSLPVTDQYEMPLSILDDPQAPSVPGGQTWTSNPISSLSLPF